MGPRPMITDQIEVGSCSRSGSMPRVASHAIGREARRWRGVALMEDYCDDAGEPR
jgi:hypothetical protein